MVKKTRKTLTSKSSSLVTKRVPEFFKIFLSPESFYKMKVPIEFLEQLTSEIPGSFYLRGPSGKVWRVRLLEMGDGYYFKDGWEDFVIDNFMSNKDFCAFKYVSENCLQVQIFERNGCEKESAFEANCSQACTTNFSARHKVKKAVKNQGKFPIFKGRASTMNPSARCWGEKAVKNQGKFPIIKGRASTMNRSARCWGKKAVKNQGERLGGPFISQRRDITVKEENMALNAALRFVSKKPYAMITMRKSHVYTGFCLPLPRSFWKAHLPDCSQQMTLRDPRGKTWSVRLYVNQIHQVGQLTEGWRKISFTNNIEASDVCIFELVKPNEFKLHIFRVIEETVPLRRLRDM
ncbi:hypothetical protein C5167_012474 [Papaver somniferum]|uniref:TF-B3 domain-containing protein n=1 Tax=Papaver somniferum TaxID=3469 RepID=A0A4Y7J1H4_PAPSO|nr:B3 domain-containing protein Os11g0197600-like [Papaver somniferum]RZC53619.1 hypothetical protein C5167_012474 [Papaver somniferum]